jgi:hypothetical protein
MTTHLRGFPVLWITLVVTLELVASARGIVQFQNRDPAAGIDAPIFVSMPELRIDGADPLWRAALLGGPT